MWQALQPPVCCSSKEGSFETKVFLQKYSKTRLPSFGDTVSPPPSSIYFCLLQAETLEISTFHSRTVSKGERLWCSLSGKCQILFCSPWHHAFCAPFRPCMIPKAVVPLCVWKHLINECLRAHMVVKHTAAKRLSEFRPRSSCVGLFLTVSLLCWALCKRCMRWPLLFY